jgi:excisionase family DNA binding protein
MSLTPVEIDRIADVVADRVAARLSGRSDADALVDCHAAAELLNCSVPTVERLTRSGEIPSVKVGRLRRYRRADLTGPRNIIPMSVMADEADADKDEQLRADVERMINQSVSNLPPSMRAKLGLAPKKTKRGADHAK